MLKHFLNCLDEITKKFSTLKLTAFSPHKLKQIYDQMAFLKSEVIQSNELDKQITRQKVQLKQLSNDATNNRQILDLSKTLLQAAFVKKSQAWRIKQSAKFAKDGSWQCFATNAPKRLLEIQELQASWKARGEYATFSTPDLIGVYWRNIGVIYRWLVIAQKELHAKKSKLSQELVEQCQLELNTLLIELELVKQAIRTSLLARLEIGIVQGDLGFDDVVAHTSQRLMQLDAMPSTALPNGIHRHMTPSTLYYIRQIISIDGNNAEKDKLVAILNGPLHLKSPNRLMVSLAERSNAAGVLFLIPKNVHAIFPKHPPFYTKLPKALQVFFRDQKAIYEFLQAEDCQYLLLTQRHLTKLTSDDLTLDNLRHHPAWQYWEDLMALHAREKQRCQKALQTFSGLFQSDVRQIVKRYQTVLPALAQQLFNQQFVFLKRCLDTLEMENKTRTISHSEIFALEKIMLRLSQLRRDNQIAVPSMEWDAVLDRYHAFFGLLSQVKIEAPFYKKSTEILQKISAGQSLITPEQELLGDVNMAASTTIPESVEISTQISTLDSRENSSLNSNINPLYERGLFTINRRVAREDVWQLLQQELNQFPLEFSVEALKAHITKLKQQTELLAMLHPQCLLSSELQTQWYGYMHRLFVAIQQLTGHYHFTQFKNSIELVLDTILKLTNDVILQHEITQFKQVAQSLKSLEWDLFVSIAITPRIAALEKTLSLHPAEAYFFNDASIKTTLS